MRITCINTIKLIFRRCPEAVCCWPETGSHRVRKGVRAVGAWEARERDECRAGASRRVRDCMICSARGLERWVSAGRSAAAVGGVGSVAKKSSVRAAAKQSSVESAKERGGRSINRGSKHARDRSVNPIEHSTARKTTRQTTLKSKCCETKEAGN